MLYVIVIQHTYIPPAACPSLKSIWPRARAGCCAAAGWCASSSRTCPPAPSWPAASTGSPGRRRSPPAGRGRARGRRTGRGQGWNIEGSWCWSLNGTLTDFCHAYARCKKKTCNWLKSSFLRPVYNHKKWYGWFCIF